MSTENLNNIKLEFTDTVFKFKDDTFDVHLNKTRNTIGRYHFELYNINPNNPKFQRIDNDQKEPGPSSFQVLYADIPIDSNGNRDIDSILSKMTSYLENQSIGKGRPYNNARYGINTDEYKLISFNTNSITFKIYDENNQDKRKFEIKTISYEDFINL